MTLHQFLFVYLWTCESLINDMPEKDCLTAKNFIRNQMMFARFK